MTVAVGVLAAGREAARSAVAEAVRARQGDLAWLLRAARDGDAQAFTALVRHFQQPIYHFILRLVRRPAAAEDLSQEVFFRFWRHLGEIDSVQTLPQWLRRVAANAVVDHWRKEEARERRMQVLRAHPLARRVLKPSNRMETQEALAAVQASVDALPPKLRSVFLLRVSEALSYEAIADLLGVSTPTVRSRLFRARHELGRMLRKKMAPDYLARMYRPGRDAADS